MALLSELTRVFGGRNKLADIAAEGNESQQGKHRFHYGLYLPLEPDAAHLFFQLVSRRYEAGAMLITSNRSVAEWGTLFTDPVVATAILDRLRTTATC
jgi:hypothetical protein